LEMDYLAIADEQRRRTEAGAHAAVDCSDPSVSTGPRRSEHARGSAVGVREGAEEAGPRRAAQVSRTRGDMRGRTGPRGDARGR
jgi:hypothetical protein